MTNIVFEGVSINQTPYIIRYPKTSDLKELHRYINELSKEKTFISFQGEEISLEDEKTYIQSSLKRIADKKSIQLIVESNNKIIGVSGIDTKGRVNNHVGIFGISVAKDFRGQGIGKKLIELAIQETKKNLSHIKIIHLECFATNEAACNLYKSVGFKEYGKLPGGIAYKNNYVDEILMYYNLQDSK